MTWAAKHDASLENLNRVQGSLSVRLIMVARKDVLTCVVTDTAADVKSKKPTHFSYFPVIDRQNRIIGIYNAQRWFHDVAPNKPIENDYEPLSEDIVIGADASIFDFITQADIHPTNLVVSGNKISGLVSLSDLQQLPVRAALFALITNLEMAMALAIEKRWDDPQEWMKLLDASERENIEKLVKKAKSNDTFVSYTVLTNFSHKSKVVVRGNLGDLGTADWKNALKKIRLLRNAIAHADQYAESPDLAMEVCETVRSVYKIKDALLKIF